MRLSELVAAVILLVPFNMLAQDPKAAPSVPKTKLQAFEAQVGSVIIRGYSNIGKVQGQLGTALTVESREYTNATSGKKEYGILITVNEGGRLDRQNNSHLDYDEIESLLRGIDYVAKVNDDVTRMSEFQADYRTKDDLVVSTYSSDNGVQAAVRSGTIGGVRAYLSLDELQKFRELIEIARSNIDSVRTAASAK